MKRLKQCICAVSAAALVVTAIPFNGLGVTAKAAETAADATVKLQPSQASPFHDTDGDGLGEFEGWGTSLCWWANRVGYDETLTSEAARLFFSDEGLDMNIGRYNVGGGDLTGEVETVPVNDKAVFYNVDDQNLAYSGTEMKVSTTDKMNTVKYTASDADFGITKGASVGSVRYIGWINELGADETGKGGQLHFNNVSAASAGNYTVKLLLTLEGANKRAVALSVNGTEYVVDADTINADMIASGNNNMIFRVTIPNVALNAGTNTIVIGGKGDYTLNFVKMAVIKSGDEGVLPEGSEFLHPEHIVRSDSGVPGYATNVTKIDTTKKTIEEYKAEFTRVDEESGYAWNYNWDADKNQMNILKAAIAASGTDFLAEAFSNSPPYFMTVSGCSSGNTNSSQDNLRPECYNAFAAYMADVIEHWENNGVHFQSTDPMNEPATSYWGANSNKQEGCHFSQGESQSKILVALSKELKKKGLNDIIISGTDETNSGTNDSQGGQIDSYNALTDEAKTVISRIDTHTYTRKNLSELSALAEAEGKNLWMSEVDGSYTAGTNAGEMSAALGLANTMITEVNGLKSSAWILWNAIDMHADSSEYGQSWVNKGSNNDYLSMDALEATWGSTTSKGYWGLAAADHDNKKIVLSQKYYAYGQFSRYIRPGYTIIGSGSNTLAAYDPDSKKVVIVAINTAGEDKTWKFDLSAFTTISDKITAIRTSGTLADGEHWADVTADDNIVADTATKSFTATMKANSITTYTVEGAEYDSSAEVIKTIDPVNVYTVDGIAAELPDTVKAQTNKNNTIEAEVTWNLEDVDLTKDATVTGTVEGSDVNAEANVKVVSANMQYFIDCNPQSASTSYADMDAYADLLNETADQAYEEGSWGYLDSYGAYNSDDYNDIYAYGWYANGGQTIQYKIPLAAGTYKLTLGFKEWWTNGNKSRPMKVSMTVDGQTTDLGDANTWENSYNWWNREYYDFTLDQAATVTFNVAKNGGPDPTLSFMQIQHVLNLDSLKAAITKAAAIDTAQYPSRKVKTLKDAVAAGRELTLKAATTQEQIDAGTEAIENAIAALDSLGYTDAEIAANDNILYLVNCGTSDASIVPDGYKLGLYQSNVNQQYGEDADTRLTWGYQPNDENTKMVSGGSDPTTLTGSYVYMGDSDVTFDKEKSGFKYDFTLPDRTYNDYIVTVGFRNPWSARTVNIKLEGETVESNLNLAQSTLVEKEYELKVTDGELNVMVHSPNRTSQYGDPILSYIIVKAVPIYTADTLTAMIAQYQEQMEGHTYGDASKAAFEAAVAEVQEVAASGTTDQETLKAAAKKLTEAFEALKEVFTYDSITGVEGARMYDNNGEKIQAHGGQIQKIGDTYYWIGEDRTNGYRPMPGVHMYSSKDLYNWTDEGVVLRTMTSEEQFDNDEYFKALYGDLNEEQRKEIYVDLWAGDGDTGCVMERPKMLYNEKTGKYVIWFHADGTSPYASGSGSNYAKAKAGIAIADNPAGPYKLLGSYLLAADPNRTNHGFDSVGGHVRDMNLFKDDDGTAYVMYSSEGNEVMYVARLNEEYTGLAKDPEDMVLGVDFAISSTDSREGPAMFKYNNKYYMITSGCTGWSPNQAQYAVADHPLGPWTRMGDPCTDSESSTTYRTQSTCVFPVDAANGKFIYMGDRWMNPDNGGELSDSRYVWLPVEFLPGDQIALRRYSDWTLEDLEGKGIYEILTDIPDTFSSVEELKAALPDTVTVKLGTNEPEETKVTWSGFPTEEGTLGTVNITGTMESGRTFTHVVNMVDEKMIYFFDSAASESSYVNAAKAFLDKQLRNTAADQKYTPANSAGYTGVLQSEDGSNYDLGTKYAGNDIWSQGYWAAGNKNIDYAFDLEAGEYTVATGYQEWWNTSRMTRITVTANGETLATKDFTLAGSDTKRREDLSFTLDENATVTVSISKTGNPDPVLSWIAMLQNKRTGVLADKTDLNAAIESAAALVQSEYTAATWTGFAEAYEAALTVQSKVTASDEDVAKAAADLTNAMSKLVKIKSVLEGGIAANTVPADQKGNYTDESWKVYETMLAEAQKILAKDNLTENDVQDAMKMIEDAKAILEVKKAVSVQKADQEITYTKSVKKAYAKNKKFTLDAKLSKGDGKLTYVSTDSDVATVSANGQVTLKGVGVCDIMICAAGTDSYNAKAVVVTLKVTPKKAAIKSVKAGSKKVSVKYKKVAQATGYQIQCSPKKNFKSGKKTVTVKKQSKLTATVSKLTRGKKYYVRVRAYKSVKVNGKTVKIYGAWSQAKVSKKVK